MTGPRQVFVDHNRVGNATTFTVPLTVDEVAGLAVGEVVSVVGDDAETRAARVTAIDGCDVRLELLLGAYKWP